jgi:N-acetyl-anhydromuramoyl-L-alanine amidase
LQQLCVDIALAYPIAHIAGHEHVSPGRKHDPGRQFDWVRLQNALKWPPFFFPDLSQRP